MSSTFILATGFVRWCFKISTLQEFQSISILTEQVFNSHTPPTHMHTSLTPGAHERREALLLTLMPTTHSHPMHTLTLTHTHTHTHTAPRLLLNLIRCSHSRSEIWLQRRAKNPLHPCSPEGGGADLCSSVGGGADLNARRGVWKQVGTGSRRWVE